MTKPNGRQPRPTVSIIGAGRLGQALAIALQSAGYPIVALVARHRQKVEKAAALLSSAQPRPSVLTANELKLLPPSDLIFIATPDDAIGETAQQLANETGEARRRTVLHTSGALASDVLSPLAKVGFHTGSLHPLVSVSEPRAGAQGLRRAFYCLEGDRAALRIARTIVKDLESNSFSIRPENKALYHAAALLAAGHLTALFDLATELLAACGPKQSLARAALLPLVESAVNNLQVSAPEKALTGTFARGDIATVRRHLLALSGNKHAEALAVYKLLGLRSLELAAKNKLDPQRVKQIKNLLKDGGRDKG
jgi:predicted short-subunit dehydrogenase-like oxidoreductase (DUF2520 family)